MTSEFNKDNVANEATSIASSGAAKTASSSATNDAGATATTPSCAPEATPASGAPTQAGVGGSAAGNAAAAAAAAAPARKNRTITIIQIILGVILVGVLAFVGVKIAGNIQASNMYNNMKDKYAYADSVNFSQLAADYPNAVAWIRVDGLPTIDYPVMQADNNDFYLKHGPNGDYLECGSIYLDYRNKSLKTDRHSLIYGHCMNDGSMFGTLSEYQKEDFFKANGGKIHIYTPDGNYTYQIFAVNIVNPDNEAYTVGYSDPAVFKAFAQNLKDGSLYDTGVSVDDAQQVITLSTCSDNNRLIVSAKRIS